MSEWEEISDVVTPEEIERVFHKKPEVGMTLTFNQEGSLHTYKIMKLPANGKVWVRRLYGIVDPKEMEAHFKQGHTVDFSIKVIKKYGGPRCRTCRETLGIKARKANG